MIVASPQNVFLTGADIIVVTTNSYIKSNGSLVMGRGAALEATQRLPGIALECGKLISDKATVDGLYGFLLVRPNFGIFQVKRHFRSEAELDIVEMSAKMLDRQARRHPQLQFALNFPAIGYGRKSEEQIAPLIALLPDNILVCRL